MNKMWSIHTMDHDSALKREDIVTHATTCLTPDYITLSETSQMKKDKYYLISLIQCTQSGEIHRDKKQTVGARGRGRGKWGATV